MWLSLFVNSIFIFNDAHQNLNICGSDVPQTVPKLIQSVRRDWQLKLIPFLKHLAYETAHLAPPLVALTEHHAMEVYMGSGGKCPCILDLSTSWRWVVSCTVQSVSLPSLKSCMVPTGIQSWSGHGNGKKIPAPAKNRIPVQMKYVQ